MAVAPAILGEPTAEAGRPAARGPALMRMDAIDSIRVRCCCCCFIPRGFLLPPLLKLTRFHVFRYFCLQQQQRGGQTGKSNIISFPFLSLARSSCLCTSCAELLSSLRSTSSRWSVFQFGSDVTRLALFLSSPRPRCSWLPSSARQRRMRPSESQTILYPLIFFTGDIVSSRLCQNSIAFLYE